MVDYKYQGQNTDKQAPLGNKLLGYTEPAYAVLFTAEAIVKIVAQGFIMSKKSYLRDPWNVLDFIVVITSLLSFSPDISSVSILRSFRLFKPLRNLQVFPSMRLLMRTLVASADRLRFLIIFYFFVVMVFSIIGVNLMQGVTSFRCRQTPFPVDGDWLVAPDSPSTCYSNDQCQYACGSLYETTLLFEGNMVYFPLREGLDLARDSRTQELMFGFANFDNLFSGMLTLFQTSFLQDWYRIMYAMQNGSNAYISSMFFVIYVLMSNYFMHILTIGIIMQKFIEVNEHKERQDLLAKLGQGETIEELKNTYHEQLDKIKEKKKRDKQMRTCTHNIRRFLKKISNVESRPLPNTPYHQNRRIAQVCWRIHQNFLYETVLTVLAIVNGLTLALIRYPATTELNIDFISAIVAVIFFVDQLVKLVGQGFHLYIRDYENAVYSFTSVGSLIQIGLSGGKASPLTAMTLIKVFKLIRRSNLYKAYDQLTDSIIFTLSVMLSYCAIMVLFVYIFSLLGMQFFAGKLYFNRQGYLDKENGQVPRLNFDSLTWSVTTVLSVLIGNDWNYVMFNCMLASGWHACFYFIAIVLFGDFILMNLFLAILIGNFEEASLISRDTKFFLTIKRGNRAQRTTPVVTTEANILTDHQHYDTEFTPAKNKATKKGQVVPYGTNDGLLSSDRVFLSADKKNTPGDQTPQVAAIKIRDQTRQQQPINDKQFLFEDDVEAAAELPKKSKIVKERSSLHIAKTIMIEKVSGKEITFSKTNNFRKIVVAERKLPFRQHYERSSMGIFHKSSPLRQYLFNAFIDPEHTFKDRSLNKVSLEQLDPHSQQEMIANGYKRGLYFILKRSHFYSVEWEAVLASSQTQSQRQQRNLAKNKKVQMKKLHNIVNYLICFFICADQAFLILSNPVRDPESTQTIVFKYLEIACTVVFMIELTCKIIAMGFMRTSIKGQRPFMSHFWNCVDCIVILLSILDYMLNYGRYDGLLKTLKCIRTIHLFRLFKNNDLLKLIFTTLQNSLQPILIILCMTLLMIFIYGIMAVHFFCGAFYHCTPHYAGTSVLDLNKISTRQDCLDQGGLWENPASNFDNIFNAMLTLFEMLSAEGWLDIFFRGVDARGIGMQPVRNNKQEMILFFMPFMIVGHIFIWRLYGGVMIETFNRARDKFFDYALMSSEQRNWVEMQRSLIDRRLKVRVDEQQWKIAEVAQKIVQSSKFDYFILSCIFFNTVIQAISFFNNPPALDIVQIVAGYIFAAIFNLECILKMTALGKYYFWESHNIFDFVLILGTDLGIIMSLAVPDLSIGPLATLLRAFRIGRILRLLKQKKSLKMLIDTIFYIIPILINIVSLMQENPLQVIFNTFRVVIILVYTIIGMHVFSKVIYQAEISGNANFDSFGTAFLLLFRCVTGQKWDRLMREYAFAGSYQGRECVYSQSYQDFQVNGPLQCGTQFSYPFFLSFVVLMQLMVVNLFIAIVLEGFAQFSIQNNSIVSSQDYDTLIDLWAFYDPQASGWIKPKSLAFLMYELPAPLGKQEDYKEILKKTLDHNTIIKQYSEKKAINMKTKFIYNEEKGLILPHNTVLKLFIDLDLPVYSFEESSMFHFKDVCLTVTKKAMRRHIEAKKDLTFARKQTELQFDRIPEEQQRRLDERWRLQFKSLGSAQLIDKLDSGKLWAGLYILNMIRMVNNGFNRVQIKKKIAQSRMFKQVKKKHARPESLMDKSPIGIDSKDPLKAKKIGELVEGIIVNHGEYHTDALEDNRRTAVAQKGLKGTLGGPQRRGRSPLPQSTKDHIKSTWWMGTSAAASLQQQRDAKDNIQSQPQTQESLRVNSKQAKDDQSEDDSDQDFNERKDTI